MTQRLSKIYFVHEGRESYPEIKAYAEFFGASYACEEIHPRDLDRRTDLGSSICWMIMGFYPRRPKAGLVIHDYRSLSVGRTRPLKDLIKRFFNAVPDIRIFQNEDMKKALGLGDNIKTVFLPMGVPSLIAQLRAENKKPPTPSCDFCYIGVMSQERRSFLMLDSFLKRFGATKTFHLYGAPEQEIEARYKDHKNIVFHGRQPQESVLAALLGARVAVNYFPVHAPHCLQTPTKLLEYGALGLRILCNEQVQSRRTAERYGLHCLWGSADDMFANVPDVLGWEDNASFAPEPLFWPQIIAASGIAQALREKEGRL